MRSKCKSIRVEEKDARDSIKHYVSSGISISFIYSTDSVIKFTSPNNCRHTMGETQLCHKNIHSYKISFSTQIYTVVARSKVAVYVPGYIP